MIVKLLERPMLARILSRVESLTMGTIKIRLLTLCLWKRRSLNLKAKYLRVSGAMKAEITSATKKRNQKNLNSVNGLIKTEASPWVLMKRTMLLRISLVPMVSKKFLKELLTISLMGRCPQLKWLKWEFWLRKCCVKRNALKFWTLPTIGILSMRLLRNCQLGSWKMSQRTTTGMLNLLRMKLRLRSKK